MSAALSLGLTATLPLSLPLRLARPCHARGASRGRRERRRWRVLLQHVLELRIHRRRTALGGDHGELMTSGELVEEGILARQICRHVAFWTICDLDDRITDPQPCLRGQLTRAAV